MKPLYFVLVIALVVRIWFASVSHHLYYPDEMFQSLEQSYRLVQGYGVIPWDYAYGLRSYVLPLLLALPLKLGLLVSPSPLVYTWFPQGMIIGLSLLPVIAAYVLVKRLTRHETAALVAALSTAVWYEMVYFAPRALTETVAVDLFAAAMLCFFTPKTRPGWGGFLLTAATLMRPQYFVVPLVLGWQYRHRVNRKQVLLGSAVALFLFGLIDAIYLHQFLGHLMNNIRLSYLSGISSLFGHDPWWFYLINLLIGSAGTICLLWFTPKNRTTTPLWLIYLGTLGIHSLIGHKEYRFIYVLIPLTIMLIMIGLARCIKKSWQWVMISGAVATISLLGMTNKLPYQTKLYGQPLLLNDPIYRLYQAIPKNGFDCGVFNTSRNWVYSPGYYQFGRSLPLYSADYPPPSSQNIAYLILPTSNIVLAGFTPLATTESYDLFVNGLPQHLPGYTLYQKAGECARDPAYSNYRSFPVIDAKLQQLEAKRVL